MKSKEEVDGIISWFSEHMPDASSELKYESPFSLLVAVILSAQCTDKRVNTVTPALLERFPNPEAMARASAGEILPYIRSVSYPNNKANHLWGTAKMLVESFNGQVPPEPEALQKLPGVGRKTANVVASVVYKKNVIAVDTHVFRVAHRLGFSNGTTPLAVENDLNDHFPVHTRARAHHWLILHGRYVCTARKPKCDMCDLRNFCDDYKVRTAI